MFMGAIPPLALPAVGVVAPPAWPPCGVVGTVALPPEEMPADGRLEAPAIVMVLGSGCEVPHADSTSSESAHEPSRIAGQRTATSQCKDTLPMRLVYCPADAGWIAHAA